MAVLQRAGFRLSLLHRASFPPLGTIGPRSGLAAMMPRTAQRLFLFPGPLLAVPDCFRSLHAAAFSYLSVSHTEKTLAAGARTKQREGGVAEHDEARFDDCRRRPCWGSFRVLLNRRTPLDE